MNAHQLDFNELLLSFLDDPVVRYHYVALGLRGFDLADYHRRPTLNPIFESLTLLRRIYALSDSVEEELLNTSLVEGWIST